MLPYAQPSLCTRGIIRSVQLNPHLSEIDLLLLSTWLGHIHYVQLDPILLGTGDQSKQSQSNHPIQLTKKPFLWWQKM